MTDDWPAHYRSALARLRRRSQLLDDEAGLVACLGATRAEALIALDARGWIWSRGEQLRAVDDGAAAVLEAAGVPLAALAQTPLAREAWLLAARASLGAEIATTAATKIVRDLPRGRSASAVRHAELLELELLVRVIRPMPMPSDDWKVFLQRALVVFEATAARATQLRCIDVLARLALISDDAANAVFSESVARSIHSMARIEKERASRLPFGALVGGLLKGTSVEQQRENVSLAERRRGLRYASLAGVVCARHPAWFDEAYDALRRADGESGLAAALIEGLALSGESLTAFADRIASAAIHAPPVVRATAIPALTLALPSEVARQALATLCRDPDADLRELVAASPGYSADETSVLRQLVLDPEPAVRAIAAQHLFLLEQLDPEILDGLWTDYARGSARLRSAAARAIALAGRADAQPGSSVEFGGALVEEVARDPSAAHALAVWGTPAEAWEILYRRALEDADWFGALGRAVDDGWPGLLGPPPAIADQFERRAIAALADDELLPAAATLLAVDAADRVLRSLFANPSSLDGAEAALVATLASGSRLRHPALGEILYRRALDEDVELGERATALIATGQLASPDPGIVAGIEALLDGPLADPADIALAHLAAAKRQVGIHLV